MPKCDSMETGQQFHQVWGWKAKSQVLNILKWQYNFFSLSRVVDLESTLSGTCVF